MLSYPAFLKSLIICLGFFFSLSLQGKEKLEGKYIITKGDKPYGEEYFKVVYGEDAVYGASSFVPVEMKGKIKKKHAGPLRSHITLSRDLKLRKFKRWWYSGKKEMHLSTFIYKDSLRIRVEEDDKAAVKEIGSPKSVFIADPEIFFLFNFIVHEMPKVKKEMQGLRPVALTSEIFKLEPAGEEEIMNLKGEKLKVEKYLFSGGAIKSYIYVDAKARVVMVVTGDLKAILEQ